MGVSTAHAQQTDKPELVLNIGHAAPVVCLAYAPGGRVLASGAVDRTVKLWDTRSGALLRTVTDGVGIGTVTTVAFSADGKTLAAASRDGSVRLWDAATGHRLRVAAPPAIPNRSAPAGLSGIAVYPGNPVRVASAWTDGSVTLWQVGAGAEEASKLISQIPPNAVDEREGEKKGTPRPVRAVAFSADGRQLATGADDGTVILYDSEGTLQYRMRGHAMPIHALAFSADGGRLVNGCNDGIATIWDTTTGKRLGEAQMGAPADAPIYGVAFSADGATLVTVGSAPKGSVYAMLWDGKTYAKKADLAGHTRAALATAISSDDAQFATAGRDDTIRLWDRATGKALRTLGGVDQALGVAASSTLLATAGSDGRVRLWNRATGELQRILDGPIGGARTVAFSPDGKILVSGGADKTVRRWDAATGKALGALTGTQGTVNALAFSADGTLLAAGGGSSFSDGEVFVWEVKTGKPLRPFTSPSTLARVNGLAFSPDGKTLMTGSGLVSTGQVRLWDVATGQMRTEDFTPMPINAVAFSSDGALAVAASALRSGDPNVGDVDRAGDEVRLYSGRSGAFQRSLSDSAPDGAALGISFLAGEDTRTVATTGADGSVRLWDLRAGALTATLTGGHAGEAVSVAALAPGLIVTAGLDGTTRVWSVGEKRLLASLVPLPDAADPSAWVAATPEGYFDASPGADRRLAWRVGADLFPVEAYESTLHKPDALRRALAGQATSGDDAARRFGEGTAVPPQVIFESPRAGDRLPGDADTITVKVLVTGVEKVARLEVTANGRPINGKPLELGAKPLELGAKPLELGAKPLELGAKPLELGAKPLELGAKAIPAQHRIAQEFSAQVKLPAGGAPVTLAAVAFDPAGLAGREEVRVARGGAVLKQTGGVLRVLAVGVSTYKNPHFNLKYARSDAESFAGLWQKAGGALYNKVTTTVLSDANATTANIRSALSKLQDESGENDTVALFLSGHGIQAGEGDYYFATHDVDPATADTLQKTGLPWAALQTTLAQVKARRVLLFLDACHSGGALGEGKQASTERMAELLAKRAGVLVFASSRGEEFSYEMDSAKHGAFTEALIEGLANGKADLAIGAPTGDGIVTAEELLAYLRGRVPQMTEGRQTPTCPLLRDFGDAYPVARLR